MVGIIFLGNIGKGFCKTVEYIANQLNEFADDKVFIDLYKGNALKKLFYKDAPIEKLLLDKFDNWNDVEKYITIFLKKYDTLIVWRSFLMNGYKIGDNGMIESFIKRYKIDNEYSMNFMSIRRILEKIMIMKVAADEGKKVIQIVADPQEVDFSDSLNFKEYKRYFILKRQREKYMPDYENIMFNDKRNIGIKKIDLFFIGSIVSQDRNFLYDIYNEMKDAKKIKFSIYDKGKFKENRIEQDKYYDFLSKAKYTIIIKPYDHNSFSMRRFFEAISNDCIPLILKDVCLDEVKNTFPDIYDIIIRHNLLVDINAKAIQKRIKRYDNDKIVIKEIKESKSFKKITDYNKVKNFYNKLLGV